MPAAESRRSSPSSARAKAEDRIATVKLPLWAKALDAVAIIMAILAISVAITGGFRIVVFDVRISVTDWWRPALWCLIALAVRHAIVRHDPVTAARWPPASAAGGKAPTRASSCRFISRRGSA